MLIDWLTLRIKLDSALLGRNIYDRVLACIGMTICVDSCGVEKWRKHSLDIDKLRSDSQGLFWSITSDGQSQRYLTIGASPSSIENDGLNVFGSTDIQHCATVLIEFAARSLESILPNWTHWQLRRLDITANYDLGDAASVKQALRLLLGTDAARRRPGSDRKGGDSVYWNETSDLQVGKAYHKGAQLRFLCRKGNLLLDDETLDLADSLLRLELKLCSRWFRRYEEKYDWHTFTTYELSQLHHKFFDKIIGTGLEVADMDNLLRTLEKVAPTKGKAMAAYATWGLIKSSGYEHTKAMFTRTRFYNHLKLLELAGLSRADLCNGNVIPFRRHQLVLLDPVTSWTQIRRIA